MNELREAEEGVEECSRIFLDSDSRFSNCFEAVDPRPYFWHCVNSFNRPEFDLANANTVCNVASAYRTQCLNQKISLPSLMECAEGEVSSFFFVTSIIILISHITFAFYFMIIIKIIVIVKILLPLLLLSFFFLSLLSLLLLCLLLLPLSCVAVKWQIKFITINE